MLTFKKSIPFGFCLLTSCIQQYDYYQYDFDPNKIRGNLWNKEEIVVCWDDENVIEEEHRLYMQNLVQTNWDDNISVDFIGWKLCSETKTPDIVVINSGKDLIIDGISYGGYTSPIGMPSNENDIATVTVAFEQCNLDYFRWTCVGSTMIHEFGHVLNLSHEQSRPDTPEWCSKAVESFGYRPGTNPDQNLIGPWDPFGIMNYCSQVEQASEWDIKEVQLYYGEE